MKDNTAAVHVQVPVEVTSFLLNEKRTEITKIELKQRVTVLLVPNKHLETPNYKLERLRHDDPRLEGLQASYTMVEEPSEEVGITRRRDTGEKGKPRQEPIIKGVLPDQPAPPAPPPPAPKPVPAPVVAAPAPAPAPVAPAPAGGGFFGWIKRLFSDEAPVATPASAATVPSTTATAAAAAGTAGAAGDKREPRRGDRDRGERGGRGGERTERGERGGRGGRDRNARGARPEGQAGEAAVGDRPPRAERGERGERGEPRADRAETRGDNRNEPRAEGREGSRRGGPRPERSVQPLAADVVAQDQPPVFVDSTTGPGPSAADAATPGAEGEREGGRRRRRRGGRDRGGEEGLNGHAAEAGASSVAATEGEPASSEATAAEAGTGANEAAAEGAGESPREGARGRGRGRGRGRRDGGRDDGPTGETSDTGDASASFDSASAGLGEVAQAYEAPGDAVAPAAGVAGVAPAVTDTPAWTGTAVPAAPAPVVAAPVAPVVAAAVARPAEPFVLPIDSLQSLAGAAGLEWINSDADKIRLVQETMAAEPPAIHVPRFPKPAPVIDEGPLVLVETKKDLSQLKLPFEQQAAG